MVDGKKQRKEKEQLKKLTNKHLNAKPLKNARPVKSTDPWAYLFAARMSIFIRFYRASSRKAI